MPSTPTSKGIQTLAYTCRVIREKKDQTGQKEWGSKTTSQSAKIYQELKTRPPTNAKSMPGINLSGEILVGSSQQGRGTAILQITMRDLGTKKWILTADAARNGRGFTFFHVRMQDHKGLNCLA